MRKHIDSFKNFKFNENGGYEPDHDNILEIMKDVYGYGDLAWNWLEDFEQTKDFITVTSDEEYTRKLDVFIDPHLTTNVD